MTTSATVQPAAVPAVAVPPADVTVTSTVMAVADAGAVAVICVSLLTVKLVAGVLPNDTDSTPVRLVPVITTAVPPFQVPLEGVSAVTVGPAR